MFRAISGINLQLVVVLGWNWPREVGTFLCYPGHGGFPPVRPGRGLGLGLEIRSLKNWDDPLPGFTHQQ